MINVEIIDGTISPIRKEDGTRPVMCTARMVIPRIVLAELNTHRILGKNSASSRAIPAGKMRAAVINTPFSPIRWLKEHSGMQGYEEITDPYILSIVEQCWKDTSVTMLEASDKLSSLGVTKQIANRLLEPFMYHTVLVSATEWDNFTNLRAHPAAEIHIQEAANKFIDVYNRFDFVEARKGTIHLPFSKHIPKDLSVDTRIAMSVMMAARTSYTVIDDEGKPWPTDKYVEKYNDLKNANPIHASPFDHVAYVMDLKQWEGSVRTELYGFAPETGKPLFKTSQGWNRQLRGFIPLRSLIGGNETVWRDTRLKKFH